ncbi:MAG: Structural maintenance of chromosomes protein 6 [Chaenotheca gracillima]|nr:MAG: Structural maintenance of chromosomes protein 6 [Chaenotheca gracillima]
MAAERFALHYCRVNGRGSRDSCKDKNSAQSPASGGSEATVAKVRKGLVRRMHNVDNRKLVEGWNKSALALAFQYGTIPDSSGIGFVAFDTYKSLLQDESGKISGPRTVIAGFGAGVTESLLAVTPFESIKTTLIDDRKSGNPRMRGFLHGSKIIWQERGMRGFFQGFVPTTARQSANSATRFGSYTMLKQFAQGYVAPGEKLGTLSTFGIGGIAGLITVYVTQPLDTIKTRMQSIEARKEYKNSFVCATRIFKDEGVLTFWSGALPRLVRLMMSGGIVFTMYEKSIEAMDRLDPEKRYI